MSLKQRHQTFRQGFYTRNQEFATAQAEARARILHDIELYLKHGLMDDSKYGKLYGPFIGAAPYKIESWTDEEVYLNQHYEVVRLYFKA